MALVLLEGVWSGESNERQQLRQLKGMLDRLPPPGLQEKLKAMSPKLRARLDALSPEPRPLLRPLVSLGLVMAEGAGPEDANPELACHELVRERIRAWMAQQTQDRGDWTENAIRLA